MIDLVVPLHGGKNYPPPMAGDLLIVQFFIKGDHSAAEVPVGWARDFNQHAFGQTSLYFHRVATGLETDMRLKLMNTAAMPKWRAAVSRGWTYEP